MAVLVHRHTHFLEKFNYFNWGANASTLTLAAIESHLQINFEWSLNALKLKGS